jgi:hypothetical protein
MVSEAEVNEITLGGFHTWYLLYKTNGKFRDELIIVSVCNEMTSAHLPSLHVSGNVM